MNDPGQTAHDPTATGFFRFFPRRYFLDAKPVLLELLDPRGLRILDAGCAGGANGELMKRAGAREVVGIELAAEAAELARARLDGVIVGDLATVDLAAIAGEPFDALLFIDVLEHLLDPQATLVRYLELVKPGGLVVASIPNVAHVWVIANLLAGRWPQRDSGIFDRTHLRFFARRDMVHLLESAGLQVSEVRPYFGRYRSIRALSLGLSLYVFRNYFARQYLLVARKPAA
jgi:2-polyprenyl-3-methyl-5-hydroxy-6-metoxy-1,4-benzoquinol methylase